MAGIAASGGSTNGVLHLLAIAREAGVELTLDELAEVGGADPVIASLAPAGATSPTTSTPRADAALDPRAAAAGLLDGDAPTVTGANARRGDARTRRSPTARSSSRATRRSSRRRRSRCCAGTSRPDGSLVKVAGTTRSRHRGPARVFDSEEACADAVRAGLVPTGDVLVVRYEGPAGGPGCARC